MLVFTVHKLMQEYAKRLLFPPSCILQWEQSVSLVLPECKNNRKTRGLWVNDGIRRAVRKSQKKRSKTVTPNITQNVWLDSVYTHVFPKISRDGLRHFILFSSVAYPTTNQSLFAIISEYNNLCRICNLQLAVNCLDLSKRLIKDLQKRECVGEREIQEVTWLSTWKLTTAGILSTNRMRFLFRRSSPRTTRCQRPSSNSSLVTSYTPERP